MMVCIDVFIFALSPPDAFFASAIFWYESFMMDSNWGCCSGVSFKTSCHLAIAFLAMSSGEPIDFGEAFDFAPAGLASVFSSAIAMEAMPSTNKETNPRRIHFISSLPETPPPTGVVARAACSRAVTLARVHPRRQGRTCNESVTPMARENSLAACLQPGHTSTIERADNR